MNTPLYQQPPDHMNTCLTRYSKALP
jgi:hypothetical protein